MKLPAERYILDRLCLAANMCAEITFLYYKVTPIFRRCYSYNKKNVGMLMLAGIMDRELTSTAKLTGE